MEQCNYMNFVKKKRLIYILPFVVFLQMNAQTFSSGQQWVDFHANKNALSHPTIGAGVGEWGDVGFARSIINNRQVNGLSNPVFNIYLPGGKSYIKYGPKSTRNQYGR